MTLEQWASLGTAVGGFGTAFGFLLAWTGLRAWRDQKKAEHAADAARRAYEALNRFLRAIDYLASPLFSIASEVDEYTRPSDQARRLFDARRTLLREDLRALDEVAVVIDLSLGDKYRHLVYGAEALRGIVEKNFALYCVYQDDGLKEQAAKAFTAVFGGDIQARVAAHRTLAREALGPLATYEPRPLLSWVFRAQRRRLMDSVRRRKTSE